MKITTQEQKKGRKYVIARVIAVLSLLALQVLFIFFLYSIASIQLKILSFALHVAAILVMICLYRREGTGAGKMPWIALILAVPIVGMFLFPLLGLNPRLKKTRTRYAACSKKHVKDTLSQDPAVLKELQATDPYSANIAGYITGYSSYPLYRLDSLNYFAEAEDCLEAMKEALRGAKKSIFMEYAPAEDGRIWTELEEILANRAKAGVDVRVIYDDMSSIPHGSTGFSRHLQSRGIKCRVFNAFVPILNIFLNNRDHRRITVVDNMYGFTGGFNLCDEYFHLIRPYGQWKDHGVRLTGEAVNSLTACFLEMWDLIGKDEPVDGNDTFPAGNAASPAKDDQIAAPKTRGFIQPFGDSLMCEEKIAENVYISMLGAARDYVWFVTPYLVISDEMNRALTLAAKRGVDVRLITPGIPDRKMLSRVTGSYYYQLAEAGVKIYEWTPGFCHCNMAVSDDRRAMCGTVGLDYRALNHHFENSCMYFNCDAVRDTRDSIEIMLQQSRCINESAGGNKRPGLISLALRFCAQLM